MRTIEQLVLHYCNLYLPSATDLERKVVKERLIDLLSSGWTYDTIALKLQDYFRGHGTEPDVSALFNDSPDPVNLLNPVEEYSHPLCWTSVSRPRMLLDYDRGLITRVLNPSIHAPLCSYSVDELYAHYVQSMKVKVHPASVQRARKGLMWVAKSYGLDDALFAIDVLAARVRQGDTKPPTSPMCLTDHMDEAAELKLAYLNERAKGVWHEPVDLPMGGRGRTMQPNELYPKPYDEGRRSGALPEAV